MSATNEAFAGPIKIVPIMTDRSNKFQGHDIAEILLKLALNTNQSITNSYISGTNIFFCCALIICNQGNNSDIDLKVSNGNTLK